MDVCNGILDENGHFGTKENIFQAFTIDTSMNIERCGSLQCCTLTDDVDWLQLCQIVSIAFSELIKGVS